MEGHREELVSMEWELFAGLPVSDYPRAVDWYERLVGTAPTFHAHETECVWTLADHRSIYVVLDAARAGHALVTFFPDDLDKFVVAAASRGVHPDRTETYDNSVRKVTFRDPDGNEIGVGGVVAEPSHAP
jgi:catechol 2,3-dioxygenase-like lactoylglutathione lyase family enzyme